ncbi:MAG: 2-oxo acid dehydrogenase subunit E2 [Sedimentisphaeraceae bacterium JB056]
MAQEIKLPQLGQTMEEGTIVNVLIKEGDKINKGDVIFEVETDKATLEMESTAEGYVKKIMVGEGDTIPVGDTVCIVGGENEEVSVDAPASAPAAEAPKAAPAASSAAVPASVKLIRLPQLGQTMEEGTIVNILVKVGDTVAKGDVLLEVETDKATLEMESSEQGVVKSVLVAEGDTIPVNDPIMVVGDAGDAVDDAMITALTGGSAPAAPTAETTAAPAASAGESLPADAKVVRLPQLGQTMEEGTIVNILIKVGDTIAKGDVLLEVETDKATLEMESSVEGSVKAILTEEGDTIPVDAPVAIVANADTQISDAMIAGVKGCAAPEAPVAEPAPTPAPAPAPTPVAAPAPAKKAVAPADRIFATPRAKMVASELGVDLAAVSAKDGAVRIVEADVRKAAEAAKSAPAAAAMPATSGAKVEMPEPEYQLGDSIPVTRMQKVVGDRMVQSKRDIPCFYLNTTVDMTDLFKFRSELNKKSPIKISFNDFIIKAMALGCKQFPIMAGQLDGNSIKVADNINVGLAISVTDGLVAPMSKDADKKSMVELAAANVAMIDRAKNGKLSPDELSGGCITLSNLGAFGVEWFIPIVVPGQCSIIGVGKIKDTLVPRDGNIMVRKMMSMTISVDHKVANGAYAAQFLDYVKKLLENTSTFA